MNVGHALSHPDYWICEVCNHTNTVPLPRVLLVAREQRALLLAKNALGMYALQVNSVEIIPLASLAVLRAPHAEPVEAESGVGAICIRKKILVTHRKESMLS